MNEYEDKIRELDTVIARLEGGDISLQEAMNLYQRGNELMVACAELLQTYQMQAETIMAKTEKMMQEANQQ